MITETDIRVYLVALRLHWKMILGVAALMVIISLSVSLFLSPTFQATALITVTEPQELLQFDPRIRTESTLIPEIYPELATSDELLVLLLEEINPSLTNAETLKTLRERLSATVGSDPSLLRLTVVYHDAHATADMANQWADIFIKWANQIYGLQGSQQLLFFEQQLEQTSLELEQAEQMLVDFQNQNRVAIFTNRLDSLVTTHAQYLAMQQSLVFLAQDVARLREQLLARSGSDAGSIADQITYLFLQLRVFDVDTIVTPLQLQINDPGSLVRETAQEQVLFLDSLAQIIDAKSVEISGKLLALEPEILDLQKQKQETETQNGRLQHDVEVAKETQVALARKVEEERITSQNTTLGIRLISQAAVPLDPVAPRKVFNASIAGALGLMLGTALVFGKEWWRSSQI